MLDDATVSLLEPGTLLRNPETGEVGVVLPAEDWQSDWLGIRWIVSGVTEELPFCWCYDFELVCKGNGNGHHAKKRPYCQAYLPFCGDTGPVQNGNGHRAKRIR